MPAKHVNLLEVLTVWPLAALFSARDGEMDMVGGWSMHAARVAVLTMAVVTTVQPIDASAQAVSARPSGRPGDWVTDNDYPLAALRNGTEGVVGFVLIVGTDGVPTQCAVSKSSGNAELDRVTCELTMKRAHFIPATDAAGVATTGTFSTTMRWQIPNDGKSAVPFPGEVRIDFDVAADGTVSNCRLIGSGKMGGYLPKDAEATACARLGPFARPIGADGKPVKQHVVSTQTTVVTTVP